MCEKEQTEPQSGGGSLIGVGQGKGLILYWIKLNKGRPCNYVREFGIKCRKLVCQVNRVLVETRAGGRGRGNHERGSNIILSCDPCHLPSARDFPNSNTKHSHL